MAVFVHGCFWHQHTCRDGRTPSSRLDYWVPKLSRNVERDQENRRILREMGWRVLVIWECQTRDLDKLADRIREFIRA